MTHFVPPPTTLLAALLACVACSGDKAASGASDAPAAGGATTTLDGTGSMPLADGAAGAPAAAATTVRPPDCASKEQAEVTGTYTVPVPADLDAYATYTVPSVEFCARSGVVTLGYDLPELLVGKPVKISFRGAPDGGLVLSSSNGTATCTESGGTWSCRERLTGLTVDLSALEEQLSTLPATEANGRRAVASTFGNDPIGVLSFAAR